MGVLEKQFAFLKKIKNGERMKIIKVSLNERFKELENAKNIEIIVIGDLHIGDKLFNKKKFLEMRDYIKNTENCFCILNGDLINNATKNSVSDIYNEELSPMQQINVLLDYLEPIKDKILVATNGNHEFRSFKESGIDIMAIVMRELRLSDRYAEDSYYLFLYFGEKNQGRKAPMVYTIYGKHGLGGGGTPGGKINKLVKMSETCFADLYVISHMHQPIATSLDFIIPDYANQSLNQKTMKFLMSNSCLEFGGYGERFNLRPASTDYTKAILSGKERRIKIEL
jgi:predicted phosphodiesterase